MAVFKQNLRQHLEKEFTNQELAQWFDPLCVVLDESRNSIRISFPHTFFGRWFMTAKRDAFELHISPLTQQKKIMYEGVSISHGKNTDIAKAEPPFLGEGTQVAAYAAHPRTTNFQHVESKPYGASFHDAANLLERHSFSAFLVNRKNDFPLAAAREAVSKAFSPAYTPFVIYGQSGSGKTHLLGAMANGLRKKSPGASFFYGGTEYLDNMYLSSNHIASVKEDVLFMDDIQKIQYSPELQDILVSLIDIFTAAKRLLVLCVDTHPAANAGFNHKLLSRLTAGLVVEVKKPDLDIRRQYLQQKNNTEQLGLRKEHLLALAQHYHDFRSIDGALTRIAAYRSLVSPQDFDITTFFEQSLELHPDNRAFNPAAIIEITARQFSVSADDITGKKRDKTVSLARPVAMLLCRELLGLSLVQVGQLFGGRDHSSIIYSINKIKKLQKSDKDTNKVITSLKQMCLTRRL